MDVFFGSARLQRTCESEKELRGVYGQKCARKLMLRLTELRAAPTLEDVRNLGGGWHELDGERAGQLAVDLAGGGRLIFEPLDGWPLAHRHGAGWKAVEAIRVLEIVDYRNG